MGFVIIPRLTHSTKKDTLLSRVEQFTDATRQLMIGHSQGKDVTVKIMKDIAQQPKIKGPPGLADLYDMLMEFLFEYHLNMVLDTVHNKNNSKNNNIDNSNCNNMSASTGNKTSTQPLDINQKPWTLFPKALVNEILWEIDRTMKTVEKHKALVAEAVALGKRALLHSNTARSFYNKFIQQTKEFGNKMKLKKQLNHLTELIANSTRQCRNVQTEYGSLQERNKEILTSIKAKVEYLQYLIEEEVRLCVQNGIKQLLELSKSLTISEALKDRLESVNTKEIANELYNHISIIYYFPDIAKGIITEGVGELEEISVKSMTADDRRPVCRIDMEHDDILPEDVYIRSLQKHDKETRTDLKLKAGQIVKQKVCSNNGETGFGWTRSVLGTKKWGFYRTTHFRLHHNPKKRN